jgi:hypothetical protein
MIRIVRTLPDETKREILETADHKCQCNVGHMCTTIVNRNSYFVTNSPRGEWISYDTVKVLCKPCIDKRHHLRLAFPPIPKLPYNLPR